MNNTTISTSRDSLRRLAIEEAIKKSELSCVLNALDDYAQITPLIYKGAVLAYREYPAPFDRPRLDTDMLIHKDQRKQVEDVFTHLGYKPILCSDTNILSYQQAYIKIDDFKVQHVFDVHWSISNRELFKNILTHQELLSRAEPLVPLSSKAMVFSRVDSLLMGCIHPVMHHHDCEDKTWIQDIILLSKKMSKENWQQVIELAKDKGILKILYRGLRLASENSRDSVPTFILAELRKYNLYEPTQIFLEGNLSDYRIMAMDLMAKPDFASRFNYLSAVLFPPKDYLLAKYNANNYFFRIFWFILYLRRFVMGLSKKLLGISTQ